MIDQRAKRQASESWGRWAETIAMWLLRLKGYRVLAHRVRTPMGEIDLIVSRARTIVFVEVKARPAQDSGIEAFTVRQQTRVHKAANYWISTNPKHAQRHMRFDLIVVSHRKWPLHLENVIEQVG